MNIEKSLEIIKAIGDNSRLRILRALLEKSYYVEELSARLDLGAPTVSFHLKKLEQAGFVKKAKEQYYVVFSVNEDALSMTLKELVLIDDSDSPMQDKRLVDYRSKVIKTYFKKGKLLRLPAQEKKRRIVLEEFGARFNLNMKYEEIEVNQIITQMYDDYCTIRRELVDRKIMARSGTKYHLLLKGEAMLNNEIMKDRIQGKTRMDRKAELKNEYKMNPRQGGIYIIKNTVNGKIFIGSGPNVEGQINKQKFMLGINSMPVVELQNDWNKYGEEKFTFEILDRLKRKEEMSSKDYKNELLLLEEMWVDKLKVNKTDYYNVFNEQKSEAR